MRSVAKELGRWIIIILDFFYPPLKKFLPVETYRYASTGGLNLVLDIFLYFIFFHFVVNENIVNLYFTDVSPHIAAFIFVFPITFASGFFLAKYVTFTKSNRGGKSQLIRYAISVGGSIMLNYILLKLFVEKFEIYPTPSKMITTVFVVIYSFIVQKYFTFQTGKNQISQ